MAACSEEDSAKKGNKPPYRISVETTYNGCKCAWNMGFILFIMEC